MGKFEDLTGQTFGQLTVIERAPNKNGRVAWRCRCTCGNECIVAANHLKNEHTTSCGCHRRKIASQHFKKHGMTNTKVHKKWRGMLERCENPNHIGFDLYGGRGIKVCERWHVFENFYEDVSQMENYGKPGYTLDRENNDKDYCPENCRWADAKTQQNNKRSNIKIEYEGEEMTLAQAAEKSGINYDTLLSRYYRGDRGDKLFRPVEK